MEAQTFIDTLIRIYNLYISNVLDILILTFVFYKIILLIRGTKAMQVAVGMLVLLIFTVLTRDILHLKAVTWILNNVWLTASLILVIVFQTEIRNVFAHIGGNLWSKTSNAADKQINEIAAAADECSKTMTGFLIAIENEIGLNSLTDTGVLLNADISEELLLSIFKNKAAPLHDGALIISKNKILAAGCILPLSDDTDIKLFGTRHRAALGLSEVSDALIVVVSEETGAISVAFNSKLTSGLSIEKLKEAIKTKGISLSEVK
ncbi:MAG: diadenylate cyclase CdaA [Elusimicrobiota bacterium]|jgi:diadenylate cyclase|nr:diadenylate cyclase CdaA [Elusimicrobiota bacterium]